MSHTLPWLALGFGLLMLLMVFSGPIRRWYGKVRRRRGGVYVWRVDHHHNRARRVTGYVGETVSYYFRARQHMGTTYYRVDGTRSMAPRRAAAQPWSDLNPRMYKVIPLPWWLCWKWVLRPLETLVIFTTWPVYNDAKNRWNPRRIDKRQAQIHRLQRDQGRSYQVVRVWTAHLFRRAVLLMTGLILMTAVYGWLVIFR